MATENPRDLVCLKQVSIHTNAQGLIHEAVENIRSLGSLILDGKLKNQHDIVKWLSSRPTIATLEESDCFPDSCADAGAKYDNDDEIKAWFDHEDGEWPAQWPEADTTEWEINVALPSVGGKTFHICASTEDWACAKNDNASKTPVPKMTHAWAMQLMEEAEKDREECDYSKKRVAFEGDTIPLVIRFEVSE